MLNMFSIFFFLAFLFLCIGIETLKTLVFSEKNMLECMCKR